MDNATFTDLLPKQQTVMLALLDQLLEHPLEQLPRSEDAANSYGVNINTAKKAFATLAEAGLIESKRRFGSQVLREVGPEQVELYQSVKSRLTSMLGELQLAGFSRLEMLAALTATVDALDRRTPRIVYTEVDFYELLLGRRELELALGQPVQPRQIDEVVRLLAAGKLQADLVVTTFFCENRLREACDTLGLPLVPLRTTPPLEQLLNFPLIPRDTVITVVVISADLRERMLQSYPHISKDFPHFAILTLEESRKEAVRLQKTRILLTQKLILEEYGEAFRHAPRVITYNRFQDDEGLDFIRTLLQQNQTTRS